MENLELFNNWLKINKPNLADSTIGKYVRAVRTVSNDMLKSGIISKSIIDMGLEEIDSNIGKILRDSNFLEKDRRGNHMYSCGIKHYRCFASDTFEIDENTSDIVESIKNDKAIGTTEKKAIIKARVGQGLFRRQLLEKYEGTCIVTGIDLPKLLVASHIRPWAVSNNDDRISCENGLLLSANIDKLFDNGLVTFDRAGKIKISDIVSAENQRRLHIDDSITVDLKASYQMLQNLEYHQDVVFVK